MNRPDKTIDTFELYQRYNIEPGIYAYSCLIKAYNHKTIIKLHVIQFECYIVKVKCTPYTFQPVLRHYQYCGDKRRFYKNGMQ